MITSKAVFLVSGGARGITAQCVIELARQYQCKFILLGRSSNKTAEPAWAKGCADETELRRRMMANFKATSANEASENGSKKPTPSQINETVRAIFAKREIDQTLHAIHQAGGKANYLRVDVTNYRALRKELAAVMRGTLQVTGIIHGSGVLVDKPIQKKTATDFERVYRAKVTGLQNMMACIPAGQLKQLVMFSSVAGFYGNIGQTDYAIANEILNKLAYQLQQEQATCRVVAIDWGPWDGGMVTPALKHYFEQQDISLIPADVGVKLLVAELSHSSPTPQLVMERFSMVGDIALSGWELQRTQSYRETTSTMPIGTTRLRRQLRLADNPFLYDHVIGGQAVLPAACAATWMVNSCEQIQPAYRFFRFDQFQVLKGVVFDESLPPEFRLDLEPSQSSSDAPISFTVKIWSEAESGKPRPHYSGQITLQREMPSPPTYTEFNLADTATMSGQSFYENNRLFHGPTFQGVERILNLSQTRLTLACQLPEIAPETQGQFPVQTINPYLLDVQLQGMLIWAQQVLGQGCLPSRAASFEQFRPLPFGKRFYVSLEIQRQTPVSLLADILAHDELGLLYTRTRGLEVTMSERLKRLFGGKHNS